MIAPTAPTEEQLWDAYEQNPSDENRNALTLHYWPLVECVADVVNMKVLYKNTSTITRADLQQWGWVGLANAVGRYDRHRDTSPNGRFNYFAYCHIKGAMFDGFRDIGWIPRLTMLRARKYEAAECLCWQRNNGVPPSRQDIITEMGVSRAEGERICDEAVRLECVHYGHHLSTDYVVHQAGIGNDDYKDILLVNVLVDPGSKPDTRMAQQDLIDYMLTGLTRQYALAYILYYRDGLTMKEVGKVVGLSESRISQICTSIEQILHAKRTRSHTKQLGETL